MAPKLGGGEDGMRYAGMVFLLACMAASSRAQEKFDEGPTNDKAQKTYKVARSTICTNE